MARMVYCPFWGSDLLDKKGEKKISCEHGMLIFYDRNAIEEYMNKYCSCLDGWKKCTLAASLNNYYDRKEKERNKK